MLSMDVRVYYYPCCRIQVCRFGMSSFDLPVLIAKARSSERCTDSSEASYSQRLPVAQRRRMFCFVCTCCILAPFICGRMIFTDLYRKGQRFQWRARSTQGVWRRSVLRSLQSSIQRLGDLLRGRAAVVQYQCTQPNSH